MANNVKLIEIIHKTRINSKQIPRLQGEGISPNSVDELFSILNSESESKQIS